MTTTERTYRVVKSSFRTDSSTDFMVIDGDDEFVGFLDEVVKPSVSPFTIPQALVRQHRGSGAWQVGAGLLLPTHLETVRSWTSHGEDGQIVSAVPLDRWVDHWKTPRAGR